MITRYLNLRTAMLLPLFAALGAALLIGPKVHAADSVQKLPDLAQEPPRDVVIKRANEKYNVRGKTKKHSVVRLAFTSQVDNIGTGPLLIDGRRSSTKKLAMTATQSVENSDGTVAKIGDVGKWLYAINRDHQHWHYQGFDVFTLKNKDGKKVGTSAKRGFCLGDRSKGFGWNQLSGANAKYVDHCGLKKPKALSVFGGISIGWGDDYQAYLEGQSIVVTKVPSGSYCLEHRATNSFTEVGYDNNVAALIVKIDTKAKHPTVQSFASSSIGDEGVAAPSCALAFAASGL